MPEIPQIDRLIAEVAARHGILLKKDDAAFALVTLNQLVLESAMAEFVTQTHTATAEFESAMVRVQARAGAAFAQDIRRVALDLCDNLGGTSRPSSSSLAWNLSKMPWSVLGGFVAGIAVGAFVCWIW